MPLHNWIKCTENDDLRYVCKDVQNADKVDVAEQWCIIYDDYINRFGLNKMYKRLLEVMKKKALIECDYVITRDRFNLTLLQMEEANLKQMLGNRGESTSISEVLVYLSKWVGYRLNPKELTTLEYFQMMRQYGKENSKKRHSRG